MNDSYADTTAIVSTDWVADHLTDSSVVIVEVNTNLDSTYRRGHVPRALGWGLHMDLEDQVRRDVPGVRQMQELLSRSGIGKGSTVVLYGDGNNRSATWGFWVLKYYRHPDVRIMDGGRMKWLLEGKPLSKVERIVTPSEYTIPAPDKSLRAMKDYIVESHRRPGVKLLDTRTIEEYTGDLTSAPGTPQPDIYRKGRIPGAVHVPWDDGATEDGTFKSVAELSALYAGQGLEQSDEIIPYCRLGVRASYSWFVLKYLLGFQRVKNYDGSWTEWGNSAGVPIETGPGLGV